MAAMTNIGGAYATTPIERQPTMGASTLMTGSSGPQMIDNRERGARSGTMDASGVQTAGPGAMGASGMRTRGIEDNGGGPEPQVPGSSNPGGQTDTGGLGTSYFESARGHMGGDDGVQNGAEKPSPVRMGGVQGTPSNPGQRGGQNTGTSGNQTSATRGEAGVGRASTTNEPRYGGASSRNPVGFASPISHGVTATHEGPGTRHGASATHHDAAAGDYSATSSRWEGRSPERTSLDRERQETTFEDVKAKASEMTTDAKRKSKELMNSAKNKLEDFFDSDIDGDGRIGASGIGGGSEGEPYGDSATGTYPYDAGAKVGMPARSPAEPEARKMSVA